MRIASTPLAAIALTVLFFNPSSAHSGKAEAIADRLAAMIAPFNSLVAKVDGNNVYVTIPTRGKIAEGALVEIVNLNGLKVAMGRVRAVMEKYAVVETVGGAGSAQAGRFYARGLRAPVRMLWLEEETDDPTAASVLNKIEEAVRDRAVFDVPPADVSRYLLKTLQPPSLNRVPKRDISVMARETSADLVATATAESGRDGGSISVKIRILSSEGLPLVALSDVWRAEKTAAVKPKESEAESGASDIKDEAGGSGFLQKKWKGMTARKTGSAGAVIDFRDRIKWKKHKLDGAVLSASVVQTSPGAAYNLAVLFDSGLRFYTMDGGGLKELWKLAPPSDLSLISLTAFDTDGDGDDEIIVNAYEDAALRSFVVEMSAMEQRVIISGLPFYFSATSDGALLAQKGSNNSRLTGSEVYTVSRTGDELEFVPAFTLKGRDIPIGLNRIDIDGDGLLEIVGISPRGRLLIYTQSGLLAWRGEGFGSTGRVIQVKPEGHDLFETIAIPPKVVAVKDESAGMVLVVGGAEYKSAGILGGGKLEKGFVRFIKIRESEYSIVDSVSSPDGWISDIIGFPADRGVKGPAVGFIRVYPGVISDESEIVLPAD